MKRHLQAPPPGHFRILVEVDSRLLEALDRLVGEAMLTPEWIQGFYYRVREYYLTTRTPEDLLDWEHLADETTQAIPVSACGSESTGWRQRHGDPATDDRIATKSDAISLTR